MRPLAIAIALLLPACTSVQRRALTAGNTIAAAQMVSTVSPTGVALAYAMAPFSWGAWAVYRAAGGRDVFPRGL